MIDLLARHRLVVCVGTGGVGKTTVSAALGLVAARAGRRTMVLTIDPARALGRALGVDLGTGAEVAPNLFAAMLDQKRAWDGFVARHAPSDAVARTLLANPFYQRLSTAFAGSTEYMAIEEMCRLVESDAYDLVVLDTPPSVHAIDFLRAPERIDRLLDQPRDLAGSLARFVSRQLERAAGSTTLRDIGAFLGAMTALVAGVRERTRRARSILRGGDAAFVLVTGPRPSILEDTRELAAALAERAAPLAAVVVNRTHPRLPARSLDGLDPWLVARWNELFADAMSEVDILDPFVASLPPTIRCARIPDGHDVRSLDVLAEIASYLAK